MSVSTKLERIAKLAKQMPSAVLTTLAHHIDIEWMHEAHRRVRKDGAAGVDGRTAEEYAKNLETNLQSLLDRAKSGDHYRAPPVRRVHIPKGDGMTTRPIGIPTFEDKILQKAVAMVLEAIYEQDFLACSYGFRPGRGAHDALQALWEQMMAMNGGWVLEGDIEKFFDSVDHAKLREVLSQRVRDGVLTRLIGKWLNAGVMEEGVVRHPETGTPQGGVMTPLTQLTTFPPSRRAVAVGRLVCATAGRRIRGWQAVHDRGAGPIDLDLRDQRADDVPTFEPGERVESLSHAGREGLKLRHDGSQVHGLAKLSIGISHLVLSNYDPRTHGVASSLELLQIDRADLVSVHQSLEATLVDSKTTGGFVATFAELRGDAVAVAATRPFFEQSRRILEERGDRLPDVGIKLFDADLRILAHAPTGKPVGVGADTAVVSVAIAALRCGFRHRLAVEGVAAARADGESLQQVSFAARVPLRQVLVARELSLRGLEEIACHDRGHINRDPLGLRFVAMRALRSTRHDGLAPNRTKQLATLRRLSLAECGLAHVRGVLENRPYRCTIPTRSASTCRNLLHVEVAHDLANRLLFVHESMEDAAHDLRLVQKNLVARGRVVGPSDVREAVRRSAHRIDQAAPSTMDLPASTPLENLRTLILCDHPLYLHEQLVFGALSGGAVKKHWRHTALSKLVEQKHLIGVLPRQPIGAVHIEDLDRTLCCAIAQTLEPWAHERGTTEAFVDVGVLREHEMSVGRRAFFQCCELTSDGCLLHLVLRGDARIERNGFHSASRFRCAISMASRLRSSTTSSLRRTTDRSITGVTISYTARRCSGDKRVGANATRISMPRRMDRDTAYARKNLSRKRQGFRSGHGSSRFFPAIAHLHPQSLPSHAASPFEVVNCVRGVISPFLANIYLHEVLDVWWEREVRPRLHGRAALVRYADDFVMVFETEEDARRVEEVLAKRFEKYGLRLHPEKTRLVRFERPDSRPPSDDGGGNGPSSFDLLGFTHFWAKSRKGNWVVKRTTAKDRFSRTLHRISMWCNANRHLPIKEQHTALVRKLRGHDAYYGITGNGRALVAMRQWTRRIWQKWLNRRSWKAKMTWERMNRLLAVFPLPPARVIHSIYRAANP